MRIGSRQIHLHNSRTWTAEFDFDVIGAFIVPIDHFENIVGIAPIDPAKDIRKNVVRFTIRKRTPNSRVGVRVQEFHGDDKLL